MEQKRLIGEMDFVHPVQFMEGKYLPEEFYRAVKGHEEDKEGGERCFICYEQRLRKGQLQRKQAALIILPPHFPQPFKERTEVK